MGVDWEFLASEGRVFEEPAIGGRFFEERARVPGIVFPWRIIGSDGHGCCGNAHVRACKAIPE